MFTTLIRFRAQQANGDQRVSFWVEAEGEDLPDANDEPLALNDGPLTALAQMKSDPAVPSDVVEKAGDCLYGGILTHANAQAALNRTLNAPKDAAGRQIKLEIPALASDTQNLPWELLHDQAAGFLEVDCRVPVVRAVAPKNNARGPNGVLGADGLRIFSVIAAHNVDGRGEWRAIRKAVEAFGHPFRLLVLTSDAALKDEIAAYAGGRGDDWITVEAVPDNGAALVGRLGKFAPHISHFFCHGRATGGGYLEIANAGMDFGGGPITLMPVDLEDALPSSAWLVLLNACSGAEADAEAGTSPLAFKLVREGVPVVVGMREEVPSNIVARFTAAFLGDALATIGQLLNANAAAPLDLSKSLTTARNRICEAYGEAQPAPPPEIAKRVKEWSLPVMSVRLDGFEVSPLAKQGGDAPDRMTIADLASELKTLRRMREMMDAMLTDDQKQQIDGRIAAVEQDIVNLAVG